VLALVALSACSAVPPPPAIETKLMPEAIPPDLLECGSAPIAPANALMQSDAARYLISIWQWGSECQSHLTAVKQSLASQSASVPAE